MSMFITFLAIVCALVVLAAVGWLALLGVGYLADRRRRQIRQIEAERAATQARMQWATYRATEQMLKAARENMNRQQPGRGSRW
ncbi:MAG: hypothetical protein QM705_15230 [Ancrocorticia sp.]